MSDKIDPMLEQQYADGQLKGEHGKWTRGSLHMTWAEFEERSLCFYNRLSRMSPTEYTRRQKEYAELCMKYPAFARRFEAERAEKLRNKNRKQK